MGGKVPNDVEVSARTLLASRLLAADECKAAEALDLVKVAQTLDPTSQRLRDLSAMAVQKDSDRKTVDTKATLRTLKGDVSRALEAEDAAALQRLLKEIDGLPLTWDAANETAIGKEVGKCAKHPEAAVSEAARTIIAKLHKLAKEQRPLW